MFLIVLRITWQSNLSVINIHKSFQLTVFLSCTDNAQHVRIWNCEETLSSGEMKLELIYIFPEFKLPSFFFGFGDGVYSRRNIFVKLGLSLWTSVNRKRRKLVKWAARRVAFPVSGIDCNPNTSVYTKSYPLLNKVMILLFYFSNWPCTCLKLQINRDTGHLVQAVQSLIYFESSSVAQTRSEICTPPVIFFYYYFLLSMKLELVNVDTVSWKNFVVLRFLNQSWMRLLFR